VSLQRAPDGGLAQTELPGRLCEGKPLPPKAEGDIEIHMGNGATDPFALTACAVETSSGPFDQPAPFLFRHPGKDPDQ
jgi:hypothetical protein